MNRPPIFTGVIDTSLEGVSTKTMQTFSGSLNAGSAGLGDMGASATSYFRGAQDFFRAVEILEPGTTPAAFGFDAAQCLELTLKAYLLYVGVSEKDLSNPTKYGHYISKSWDGCVNAGLALDATVPNWAVYLEKGHESKFLFRYAKDNTFIVLAPKAVTLDGLREVMAVVQAATGVT